MVCGCSVGCFFVGIRSLRHSLRFGQLLRCAHKCIVNIMKVHIGRNNIQVEFIRFRKKYLLKAWGCGMGFRLFAFTTGAGSSHGKRQFGSLFFTLFMTLGRLATVSERIG